MPNLTPNNVPVATTATNIQNSAIVDDGSTITLGLSTVVSGPFQSDGGSFFTDGAGNITCGGITGNGNAFLLSLSASDFIFASGNMSCDGSFSSDSGEISSDGSGNLSCQSVIPSNGFSGSGIFTTFTILNGIITAAS